MAATRVKRNFIKPGMCIAGGYVAATLQDLGEWTLNRNIPVIGGTELSGPQFGAMVAGLSCFLIESLNNIFEVASDDQRLQHVESFVLHTLGGAAAWTLIPSLIGDGGMVDYYQAVDLAKVGALTELTTQWLYENFVAEGSVAQDFMDLI